MVQFLLQAAGTICSPCQGLQDARSRSRRTESALCGHKGGLRARDPAVEQLPAQGLPTCQALGRLCVWQGGERGAGVSQRPCSPNGQRTLGPDSCFP